MNKYQIELKAGKLHGASVMGWLEKAVLEDPNMPATFTMLAPDNTPIFTMSGKAGDIQSFLKDTNSLNTISHEGRPVSDQETVGSA